MKPLYEKMRGIHIVMYADGFLPMGINKRFYWANADIVYSNIETDIEYHNMSEAIRKRYGYKSEADDFRTVESRLAEPRGPDMVLPRVKEQRWARA